MATTSNQAYPSSPTIPVGFPAASQPDIVRANQKDALYVQQFTELCHDTVRSVLGARKAVLYGRETQALAQLLYHAMTTGCGQQTLGEEYCDLLQGTASGAAPGPSRRAMLVALQGVAPFLMQRLAAGGDPSPSTAPPAMPTEAQASMPVARRIARWLMQHGPLLLRVHVALFYLFGTYYHWEKRLTGVRYTFIGRLLQQRPSYRVLGGLLLVQLGLSGLMWLHQQQQTRTDGGWGGSSKAVVLQEDGTPAPEGAIDPPPRGGESAARRCPLCLSSPRVTPTATPCGHVFCWTCVAAWCAQKPECPLCRAEVSPQQLVCVYHADF